jgi:hypothetical protein
VVLSKALDSIPSTRGGGKRKGKQKMAKLVLPKYVI